MGLVDASQVGFQSKVFRGPITHVGVLEVRELDVGSKPFAFHREAGS